MTGLGFFSRNTSIQDDYEEGGYYYLNNFNDFFHSYGRCKKSEIIRNSLEA